ENQRTQERIVFLKGEIKAAREDVERMQIEKSEKNGVINDNSEKITALNADVAGLLDEVAKVCTFLASDLASYVTGQVIPICGGLQI
ncbi:MAG: SDR family oxidoreductase, partial [Bacteroidales bacterium]|nr:SDR family oxidoreductase [Bacteroidales bacterium]